MGRGAAEGIDENNQFVAQKCTRTSVVVPGSSTPLHLLKMDLVLVPALVIVASERSFLPSVGTPLSCKGTSAAKHRFSNSTCSTKSTDYSKLTSKYGRAEVAACWQCGENANKARQPRESNNSDEPYMNVWQRWQRILQISEEQRQITLGNNRSASSGGTRSVFNVCHEGAVGEPLEGSEICEACETGMFELISLPLKMNCTISHYTC